MKINKVLLIVPPDTRPPDMPREKTRIGLTAPIGLGYIAAVLLKEGLEVKILDCSAESQDSWVLPNGEIRYEMTDEQIAQRITDFKPDLVGVSCLFSNKAFDAHNVCRIVKEVNPWITTVMGGAHPTALPEETLKDKNADYVVKGEGEYALLYLIRCLNAGIQKENIQETWRIPIENLDDLPFPARHLMPMDKYLGGQGAHSGHKASPQINMITSRGCPHHCAFCCIGTTFGAYRMRSPENVLAEIDELVKTYGVKEIDFEDDNLTVNKKRAMAIMQGIIDRKYGLYLNSPSGLSVASLDEELLDKMREAGYYAVNIAIESGTPRVLQELMHKKVDLVKAKRIVKYARSIGIKAKGFFILGYPGETKEEMQRTVDFAASCDLDWAFFFMGQTLPGTEIDAICRKNGYLMDPNMDYRYYYFRSNIQTPEWSPEWVQALKEKANYEVNFLNNTNLRQGLYDRAIEDFQEVLSLYPDLQIAKDALNRALIRSGKI